MRTCTQRLFIRNPKESQPILAPLLVKNKLFIRLALSYFPLILIFHDAKLGVLSENTKCLRKKTSAMSQEMHVRHTTER